MSYRNVIFLWLLTVSQRVKLQTAESTTSAESWVLANDVNDRHFSPKSISELFNTDNTFSTVNPIIVLQQSSTSVPSPEKKTDVTKTASSASPLPYSVQPIPTQTSSPLPPLSTQTPSSQQPIQLLLTQSTPASQPIQVSSTQQIPVQPQTITTPTVQPQPSVPVNIQLHNPLNFQHQVSSAIQIVPQNQFQNLQTYQLVPIVQSSFMQPAPMYRPLPTSTFPPRPIEARTTLKPATKPPIPCSDRTQPYPQIRIRMSSPRGITNITVNPAATTGRQTTKNMRQSSKRQNRNEYDECVKTCGDGKKRICAAPLGTRPVDPDDLRGFPSICHLACHNNFKNNKYEKLLDGRCGRLRTRIRPVDSNDKIKRIELNKSQYQVVQDPQTIIEFHPIA